MPLPQVAPDALIVDTGSYTVETGGHTVLVKMDFSTKEITWGGDCVSGQCPPNLTLADGTTARSFGDAQDGFVVVFKDSSHVANIRLGSNDKTAQPVPFDTTAFFRSPQFAELISADTAQLTDLVHN